MAQARNQEQERFFKQGFEEAETLSIQMASMNKVDIPIFYGNSDDKVTAEEYCGLIRSFYKLSHTDPKKRLRQNQMVIRVSLHLRGPAAKWYSNLEKDSDPIVCGYDEADAEKEETDRNKAFLENFLDSFKKRWQKTLNPTDKMHLRLNIKQKHSEKVLDFYARVRADMREVLEGADPGDIPADKTSDAFKVWQKWQKFMLNQQTETYFLDGLNPRLRTEITKGTWDNLADLVDKADKMEKAVAEIDDRRNKTTPSHAVEATNDINNMSANDLVTMLINGRGGGTFRGRGRGRGRGSAGRGRGGQGGNRPQVQCFYCGIYGHFIRDCRKKKADNEKGIDNPLVPKREVGANNAAPSTNDGPNLLDPSLNFFAI